MENSKRNSLLIYGIGRIFQNFYSVRTVDRLKKNSV